ncbi:MAG: AAA family ATPase [Chloroflexi bacterium]|nr:AAA family ATPase [Chloroflexota bacterium]
MVNVENTRLFPDHLLQGSEQERVQYFEHKLIAHDRLSQAHEELSTAIYQPAGSPIIVVTGPTGVGKTTLLQRMIKDVQQFPPAPTREGTIVIAGVEAPALDSVGFDWRDFFFRALQVLDEPLVDRKTVGYQVRTGSADTAKGLASRGKYSRADLRHVFEAALAQRGRRYSGSMKHSICQRSPGADASLIRWTRSSRWQASRRRDLSCWEPMMFSTC